MMKRSTQDRMLQRAGGWCEQVYRSCGNGLRSSELNTFCHLTQERGSSVGKAASSAVIHGQDIDKAICELLAYNSSVSLKWAANQRPIKVAPRSISFVLLFCSRLGNRIKDEAFF
jgi:hypothetical protein